MSGVIDTQQTYGPYNTIHMHVIYYYVRTDMCIAYNEKPSLHPLKN